MKRTICAGRLVGEGDFSDERKTGGWGALLPVLGWIVIAVSSVGGILVIAYIHSSLVYPTLAEQIGTIAVGIALGSVGVAFGGGLVILGRAFRLHGRVGRLALWAKISILAGLEICLGVPLFFYGAGLFWSAATHDPTAGPPDPLDGSLLAIVVGLSAIPCAVGLAAIVVACIWGRPGPPGDTLAADGGGRLHAYPAWARICLVLGWLIVAVAILSVIICVIGTEIAVKHENSPSSAGSIAVVAGMAIGIAGIGMILVIAGRASPANAPSGRLKVWAKFVIVFGIMLSLGMPVFLGGGLVTDLGSMHNPERGAEEIAACAAIGVISFLVGIVAIVSAIIWGRRKPPLDIPNVFS